MYEDMTSDDRCLGGFRVVSTDKVYSEVIVSVGRRLDEQIKAMVPNNIFKMPRGQGVAWFVFIYDIYAKHKWFCVVDFGVVPRVYRTNI